jgi:hypothetical protein
METVVRPTGGSPGPEAPSPSASSVEMNGHTIGSAASESAKESANNSFKLRNIAVMNVPDTVNLARLQKLFEKFGPLVKCSLRPDHGGATAEYVEESSATKAKFGLEGVELDGKIIQTGTFAQLMLQKPENKKFPTPRPRPSSAHIAAPKGGVGKRGGLGKPYSGPRSSRPVITEDGEKKTGGKSNDYFKNLMSSGSKKETAEDKAADDSMET